MRLPEALAVLEDLERGMKSYEFGVEMGHAKLNDSFALLAVQALQEYLRGDVGQAAADWANLADEIRARMR